jgi:hypothetical protein
MSEAVRILDEKETRIDFESLGLGHTGIAVAGPRRLFQSRVVESLCCLAEQMRNRGAFSREFPPRLRSVHHVAPHVREELESAGFLGSLSKWVGERLALHPSAHFGCSFNWTKLCPYGDADPWHLDAAPYTAIVLLSEPEQQFTGGDLCLFLGEPADLWNMMHLAEEIPKTSIWRAPFQQAGETLLFQGKHLAHRVGPVNAGTRKELVGVNEGRLTLAIGLYSEECPERWLYPGVSPNLQHVENCWRIEQKKALLLAAIERARSTASWQSDPEAEAESEAVIDETLARLESQ